MRYAASLCALLAGCLWEEPVTNPDPMPDGVCQWFIDHGADTAHDSADTGGVLIRCESCGADDCDSCPIDQVLWTTADTLAEAETTCGPNSGHFWAAANDSCHVGATVVACVATGTL